MNGILLILVVLSMGSTYAAYAAPSSSKFPQPGNSLENYSIKSVADEIVDDIMINKISAKSAFTSSSPECWMASINTINRLGNVVDVEDLQKSSQSSVGSSFCAFMTPKQQQIFALELTHCELIDTNRRFYESNVVMKWPDQMEAMHGCAVGMGGAKSYDSSSCFHVMSREAFLLYDMLRLHTREVCVTLMEERVMLQKEEATARLLYASSAASHQIHEAALAMERTASHTASVMQVQATKIIQEQREELLQTASLTASMMQDHTTSMMREQREELQIQTENILARHDNFEVAMQKREKEATKLVQRIHIKTAALIAKQADIIKKQKRDLERFQDVTQPLSSIESYVKLAIGGFNTAKALVITSSRRM